MGNELSDQAQRFGGGATSSMMAVASILLLVAAILLFFLLPRKYLIVPFLFVSIFIPYGQVLVLGGLHFASGRILLPFAWLSKKPLRYLRSHRFQWNGVDKALICYALVCTVASLLLWGELGVLINRLGFLYEVFGTYFLLRIILRDRLDVNRTIGMLAVLCALFAFCMVREQMTGRNMFAMFGTVNEFTPIREGRLRSQAAFGHPIVAGAVGATVVPLFVGLWFQGRRWKRIAILGVLSGFVMTLTSASATPLLALVAGIAALCMWPFRRHLRWFRWGAVILIVSLHLVMKGPVWALIQHVDIVGGNSGWHRFELVNQAIIHFWDWWLFGAKNPSGWGFEMGDVSNAYISTAVNGGLAALLAFLAIFWQGFRRLGIARKIAAKRDRQLELLLWAFGAALSSTATAFVGIWYFDQSSLIWYALLAMICAVTSTVVVAAEPENVTGTPLGVPERLLADPSTHDQREAIPRHIFT